MQIRGIRMRGSSEQRGVTARELWSSAIWRAGWFLFLWLVLAGADIDDIPAAAVAIAAATWTSLRLLEPSASRRSPRAIVQLVLFFLYHSVIAGADVARR